MKINKLTPNKNVLWESSRMMLPEHKEAIIAQLDHTTVKVKPLLDEQKLVEIAHLIEESYYAKTSIEITIFEINQEKHYRGIVTYIASSLKYIKLEYNQETISIPCQAIIDITSLSQIDF